jgi:hypothetical protein
MGIFALITSSLISAVIANGDAFVAIYAGGYLGCAGSGCWLSRFVVAHAIIAAEVCFVNKRWISFKWGETIIARDSEHIVFA